MKITITMSKRETRAIENLVNKHVPIDSTAITIKNEHSEAKWGYADLKTTTEKSMFTMDMKDDFVIEVLGFFDEVISPIVPMVKHMTYLFGDFKKRIAKWSKTEDEILREVAEKSAQMYVKRWSTFIVFFEHMEDWVEVKPGTKKLKKVIVHKMVENGVDIEAFAARAAKDGRSFVFLTYADDRANVTDMEGAKAFFEDHKACW